MIAVRNLSKGYHTRDGVHRVLDDVSFTIERGDSLGILGRNGAGKSTLTRLISGIEHPTRGSVERGMSVSWPLGYFGAFQSSLSGADNARFIARIYGAPVGETLAFVEDFAELGAYLRMPVKTYSAGMKARLAFGISLAVKFDCYVVDEITGVGDFRFAERCHAALSERKKDGALIMISHDLNTLQWYCDRGAVLSKGRMSFYDSVAEAGDAYHAMESGAAAAVA